MKPTVMPMPCERCGSVYFQEAEFRQYRGGMYSSGGGEGLSPVTELPQRICICICGEPMPDASIRRRGDDARSFTKWMAAAKAHRAKQEPEALLRELRAQLATKQELAETQERLANLEQALRVIAAEPAKARKRKDTGLSRRRPVRRDRRSPGTESPKSPGQR
jgi:hypothetical protein